MRSQSGQSALEYVALLLLTVAVLAAGAVALSGGGIAESILVQLERALCIVRGANCGGADQGLCVTRSESESTDASMRVAVVRMGGGGTQLRERRSDGSVVLTLISRAGAGLQASVGASLEVAGRSLGGSLGGLVEGRVGRGRVWRLGSDAEADALLRSLSAQAARSAPRVSGIPLAGGGSRARPRDPDETFGERGLASGLRARLGRVGLELEAEDLLGARVERATGVRTLTLRRRNELSARAPVLGGGPEVAGRRDERYALRVDAAGRPLELVVIEASSAQGGARLPAPMRAALGDRAARRGRLTILERRLDLTDAESLSAASAFVRALRGPRLRVGEAVAISRPLRERLDAAGSARALAYEIRAGGHVAHAEASLGAGIGGGAGRVTESLRLVAASAREAGGAWRERGDCLGEARSS